MPRVPRLLALATAVPPFVLRQAEVAAYAWRLFSTRESEIERLREVYANAGIETRCSCVPLEWYSQPHGWVERNRLYLENSVHADQARRQVDEPPVRCREHLGGLLRYYHREAA